jgi:hypothetical protein
VLAAAYETHVAVSGTVAAQIIKLPDATLLALGSKYTIHNDSTQPLQVQNSAGTVLGYISQKRHGYFVVTDIATAAGVWSTRLNSFGANRQYITNITSAATTSVSTYSNYLTLTPTNPLPPGKYIVDYSFRWGVGTANRAGEFNVNQDGVSIDTFSQTVSNVNERPFAYGKAEVTLAAQASPVFVVQFRTASYSSGTTTLYTADIEIRRVDD